jgi:hypothetical protein
MPRPKGSGGSKSELFRLALAGIDAEIKALEEKRAEIARLASGAASAPAASGVKRKRAAVKARVAAPAKTKKKKRKVSEETRRKLKAAAEARWARERGEKA